MMVCEGWNRLRILMCICTVIAGWSVVAYGAFPQIRLEVVTQGELVAPVAMTHAGDGSGRLFTADQRGKIQIVSGGAVLGTPFLDLESNLVPQRPGFDERGLLGLAFHPDYASPGAQGEGRFYVYYSAPSPNAPGTSANPVDHQSVISEFRVSSDPNVADALSERVLMTFDQPQFNHDGGAIHFGPDGMLYISTGDGGGSDDNDPGHTGGSAAKPSGGLGNGQNRTNLLGNVLRIDPLGDNAGAYGIPSDNPFVGAGAGVREEIYAFGFRNPWRMSFDRGTGRLFVADVGQNKVEEINIVESGGNYGWRIKEGTFDFDSTSPNASGLPLIDPIAEYYQQDTPDEEVPDGGLRVGLAAVGGYVYRGSAFPELEGKYVFGDWSRMFGVGSGTLLGLEDDGMGGFMLSMLDVEGGNPISPFFLEAFGEDEDGELYLVTRTTLAPVPGPGGVPTGAIFKIVPIPAPGTAAVLGVMGLLILRRRGAQGA